MDFLFFPVLYLLLLGFCIWFSSKKEKASKYIIKTPPPVTEEERESTPLEEAFNSFTWSGEVGGQLLDQRRV